MATDALSAWLLGEIEQGRDGFQALRAIKTHRQMATFVDGARAGSMNTDDTSFIRFVVPKEPKKETDK